MEVSKYRFIRSKLCFEKPKSYFFLNAMTDLSLLGVILFLWNQPSVVAYVSSQVLLASLFFRCFALMHEAVHNTLLESKGANLVAGVIYGSFCFLPFLNWKKIHLAHHLWAGNIDKDPTMKLPRNFRDFPAPLKAIIEFCWRFWIPITAILQHIVFWKASAELCFKNHSGRKLNLPQLFSLIPPLIVISGLVYLSSTSWVFLGIAPAIILYLSMVEAINFPHHLEVNFIDSDSRLAANNQHSVTRSCGYMTIFSRHVLMNFNLHTEHHLYPDLPYHQLPVAFMALAEEKPDLYNYEAGLKWIIKARKKRLENVLDSGKSSANQKQLKRIA